MKNSRESISCGICENIFVKMKVEKRKFCSMKCVGENNRRLISGKRDESKHENFNCKTCGKECDRLKGGQGGSIKQFCSRACRSKFVWTEKKLSDKMRSKTYLVTLKNGNDLKVRSRWEAAFIKDYLEKENINFDYEPTIRLLDGSSYTPDFYLNEKDTFVEIKGFERGPSLKKVNSLRNMGRTVVYATGEVLERDFGLNLKTDYLKSITREYNK